MLQINHEKSLLIKTFIHQEMLKNKILWNGIINLSYSHKMSDSKKICFTLDKTLKKINLIGVKKLSINLDGKMIKKLII